MLKWIKWIMKSLIHTLPVSTMSGIEPAFWSVVVWSPVSTGCCVVIMWPVFMFCIMYSVADAGSTFATGCTPRPGANDIGCCVPADSGKQVSMIGKLPAPVANDDGAATRKKAGLSVAIGRAGRELAELTCHTTGALAGWADKVSAGTKTSPADASTGCDATNAGGGCWCNDADITCCWCCCGNEIGTEKL